MVDVVNCVNISGNFLIIFLGKLKLIRTFVITMYVTLYSLLYINKIYI